MINIHRRPRTILRSLATAASAVALFSAGYAQVCLEANQASSVGMFPSSVTSADLDGDGDQDLAIANFTSSTVSILINQGNGTFAADVQYSVGLSPYGVNSADL